MVRRGYAIEIASPDPEDSGRDRNDTQHKGIKGSGPRKSYFQQKTSRSAAYFKRTFVIAREFATEAIFV